MILLQIKIRIINLLLQFLYSNYKRQHFFKLQVNRYFIEYNNIVKLA